MPYSSYEKFQFHVPVSNDCDVWARYLLRLDEMRESVKIIQQALDGMPGGPVKANAPKIVLPDREADEDPDGVADPSLQDCDRRLRRACRRGLSGHRIRPRTDGLLRGLGRHRQALPRPHALPRIRHACRRSKSCARAACSPTSSPSSAPSILCWERSTDSCPTTPSASNLRIDVWTELWVSLASLAEELHRGPRAQRQPPGHGRTRREEQITVRHGNAWLDSNRNGIIRYTGNAKNHEAEPWN